MSQKHQCIVLDFDHTLFNTTLYVEALKKSLAEVGITEQEFEQKRTFLKSCCSLVDIDTFITHLSLADKKLLHDTVHDLIVASAASFIFSDVQPFINAHTETHDVIVLTQGNQELQKEKISHSNLAGITATIITTGKKDETIAPLTAQYKNIYFIDDKARHIEEVKNAFPTVITYFIARPEDHPYGDIAPVCDAADYTINDLRFTIN